MKRIIRYEDLDFIKSLTPDKLGRFSVILLIAVDDPTVTLENTGGFGSPTLPSVSHDRIDTSQSKQTIADALDLVERVTKTRGNYLKSSESIIVRANASQIIELSRSPLFKTILPNTVHK